MNNIFLYKKDYANSGRDRYFLSRGNDGLIEVNAEVLVEIREPLICHDYWMIAESIYSKTGSLPVQVIDVEEMRASVTGAKVSRKSRSEGALLSWSDKDSTITANYLEHFIGKSSFDPVAFEKFVPVIVAHYESTLSTAENNGETRRFFDIELPLFNLLWRQLVQGINIDTERLREHKQNIDFDYYCELKKFATKHDLPFEVPSNTEIVEYLEPKGYSFEEESIDYILNFISVDNDYAQDVLQLRKTSDSRHILTSITSSTRKVYPIVDTFATRTSRIYYRDPVLQNLSRKYRDIITPDSPELSFSYIDYDQFEVGVMAALSNDEALLSFYNDNDIYQVISEQVFGNSENRKTAKKLFLSYCYGMKKRSLIDGACAQGADRAKAKSFFNQFETFEEWKKQILVKFQEDGKIGTAEGNFYIRNTDAKLTEKEKRSAVSQVVQGTASLIFKKALTELLLKEDVSVKIPMHDAVLVQHSSKYDTSRITRIFIETFTSHFNNKITGKASITSFF